MDPYYWVYDAPDDLWPGYDRSVDFSVMVLDNRGYRVSGAVVDYSVYNNTNRIIASGNHMPEVRKGFYEASFTINDADAGGAGLYNDNIGIGDIDNDGYPEVIIPSDTITICAYEADGTHIGTNEMYHSHPDHDMDLWGEVPAYVDIEYETRGWGPCYQEPTNRANFANGPANIVDMNGDGINEIVVIGDVHNCYTSPYTDMYNGPYIFNADRSRFNEDGFNWIELPVDTGTPVIQNYNIIESIQPNPVTVDLDGDGNLEIIYPSYDGRMHAFWLDKTEHNNWPFDVYDASEGFYRFASEPVVADLDNNGHPEVIFTSWVEKGTGRTGKLHILDNMGNVIHEIDLPPARSGDWNGALPAPTLANIDDDADMELILNTAHSGIVVYDLHGTSNAHILWGTGRGSFLRNGCSVTKSMIRGDVDGNGFVNNQDLDALLNHVFYGIAINEWAGDMDGNGDVNILDVRILMKHILS